MLKIDRMGIHNVVSLLSIPENRTNKDCILCVTLLGDNFARGDLFII